MSSNSNNTNINKLRANEIYNALSNRSNKIKEERDTNLNQISSNLKSSARFLESSQRSRASNKMNTEGLAYKTPTSEMNNFNYFRPGEKSSDSYGKKSYMEKTSSSINFSKSMIKSVKSTKRMGSKGSKLHSSRDIYRGAFNYKAKSTPFDKNILLEARHIGDYYLSTASSTKNRTNRDNNLNTSKQSKPGSFSFIRATEHDFDKDKPLEKDKSASVLYNKNKEHAIITELLQNQSYNTDSKKISPIKKLTNKTTKTHNTKRSMNSKYSNNYSERLTIEDFRNSKQEDDDNKNITNLNNTSYIGDSSFPSEKFADALVSIMDCLDPTFERLSIKERMEKFIISIENTRRNIRLGALVALYIIKQKKMDDGELDEVILQAIFSGLKNYESQEELFLIACLELLTLFVPHDIALENVNLICMFLTDFSYPKLQNAAYNLLVKMEDEGIQILVDLAVREEESLQSYILEKILDTPHFIKLIISKGLVNDLYSGNQEKVHKSLAALNRLYNLVGEKDTIVKLGSFLNNNKFEKFLLTSTIRGFGVDGENYLINELKRSNDASLKVAILIVLSHRMPKYPKYLKIKLDNNILIPNKPTIPGSFCNYYGKVTPMILNNDIDNESYLEVNSRDLIASLQRLLLMTNISHSNPQITSNGKYNFLDDVEHIDKIGVSYSYNNFFLRSNYKDEDKDIHSNGKTIQAITNCLKDYESSVKNTAASVLGQIALPEALLSLDQLIRTTYDEEVDAQAKAIWAIGMISEGCDDGVIIPIIEHLNSNIWKIKSACLFTLAAFGERASKFATNILCGMMKNNNIFKVTVAETLIKMGVEGERYLIKTLVTLPNTDYKLKSDILASFAITNIISPNIDFIVECLYNAAQNSYPIVRKTALLSLQKLYNTSEGSITYLKDCNIIPFFNTAMKDKELEIQNIARQFFKSLGPQGELIFIDGLTQDPNITFRCQSAIGLSESGVKNLRTLLIGLGDENIKVVKTVEKAIISNIGIDNILNSGDINELISQKLSLRINIKSIIDSNTLISGEMKKYLNELLSIIDKYSDSNVMKQG